MWDRITSLPGKVWGWITQWLERGDLVPLLVVVSAAHYAEVLREFDKWWVAVPIGILVDVGHYRSVIVTVRYNGSRWQERVSRWTVTVVMTVLSLFYHWRFYNGGLSFAFPESLAALALALPLPVLIASLAYFERKGVGGITKSTQEDVKVDTVGVKVDTKLDTEERRLALVRHWERDPNATQDDLAQTLGVSRQTISNDYRVLAQKGVLKRNGHGVEVVEVA